MDRESSGIRRELVTAWQNVKTTVERLSGNAAVMPNDLNEVLRTMEEPDSNLVGFEVSPVVFKLPERAGRSSRDLFVVVRGRMAFSRSAYRASRALAMRRFGTEVGYFVHNATELDHVYGAHYDFADNEVGHPAFHAQMKSFEEFAGDITTQYGIDDPVKDSVKGVLKTIRIPTAHLDVFSVFLQLCADHLLHGQSAADEKAAFNRLLEKSGFCQGAAGAIPRLSNEEAAHCYRSRHWYPAVA